MRLFLAFCIWLLDALLKFALGYLVVFVFWRPYSARTGAAFGDVWALAGFVVGLCINGFFEGCDFLLLGLAKRVAGER